MSPLNRKLFYLILLYTCIEGLVINMTFPSKLGFIVKDALLAVSIGLLMMDSSSGQGYGALGRLSLPLGLFAFVQITYIVLPIGDLPLLARLVGLKMRLLYILTMFLAYRFVRSPYDVYKLFAVLAISAIPVSLFGIYLYFSGPEALRAMGGNYSAVVNSTTGGWRVPGTFNSPGQYGLYLTFNSIVAVALLLVPGLTMRMRIVLWASVLVMTVALLASGSRSPLLLALAVVAMVLIGLGKLGRMVSLGAGGYIIFAIGFTMLGGGVEERFGSIASMSHVERFNRTYFGQLFIPKAMETPLGLGLGAATIGARHFREFSEIILVESYFGIVAVETGLLGLATVLALSAAVLVFVIRSRAVMRYSPSGPGWYALASFVVIVVLLGPISTPLDSAPGNVYFWASLGIVAKLYDLERWRLAAQLPQQPSINGFS